MKSWSRPGIISRAVLPAPYASPPGERPSELGTVILPSVTSLWEAAGLLHKFLTGGEVLAALRVIYEPTWGEFVEVQRRKCLKNKKTRRQRNEKDMLSLFSWVAPLPFLIYSHEAKKRKGDHRHNKNTSLQPLCTLVYKLTFFFLTKICKPGVQTDAVLEMNENFIELSVREII